MIPYEQFAAGARMPYGLQRLILSAADILPIGKSTLNLSVERPQALLLHTVFDLLHFKLLDEYAAVAFAGVFHHAFPHEAERYRPAVILQARNYRQTVVGLGWEAKPTYLDTKTCTIREDQPDVRVATTLDVGESVFRILLGTGAIAYGRPTDAADNQ